MKFQSMGFIGGGRITRIILKGLIGKITPPRIVVSDVDREVLKKIEDIYPHITIIHNDNSIPSSQQLIILALHPPVLKQVLHEIQSYLKPDSLVLSLAPKIGIAVMTRELDGFERIVRMIPNACSIINAGYNPMVFSDAIPRSEREAFTTLFQNLGECPEVPEEHLEAYAILTAMGPTYFWFQLHELQELGKSFGLPESAAKESLKKMLSGTLKTLYESNLSYEESLDLIPVKPLQDDEATIKNLYRERLITLYNKIKR